MTPTDFHQWLTGFLDAAGPSLTAEQVAKIRDKAAQVSAAQVPQQPWSRTLFDPPIAYPIYTTCGSTTVSGDPNIRCRN